MAEREGSYIPTLDGWRAIAILGVMVAHAGFSRHGALGVDVFFGISGFLICTRLLQEARREGRISLKHFYIRRACRILPPYALFLAGLSVLALFSLIVITRWEWASCLLFFRNYLPAQFGGWYTGHLWSLAVEEHFYLLWPALLVLWGENRAGRWVLVLALIIAGWRVFEFRQQLVMTHLLPGVGFYGRTDIRLDALLLGCWAALVLPHERARLLKWTSPLKWLVLAMLFAACVAFQPPMAILWQSLMIPILLLGTVLHPQRYAGRLLEMAVFKWIGRLSYSLYLWQQLFLVPHDVSRPLGILQQWPINVVAVFLCATASYYVIERPMVRFGHRITSKNEPQRDLAVVSVSS